MFPLAKIQVALTESIVSSSEASEDCVLQEGGSDTSYDDNIPLAKLVYNSWSDSDSGGPCNFQPSFRCGSVSFVPKGGGGPCIFHHHISKCSGPTHPILFDQSLSRCVSTFDSLGSSLLMINAPGFRMVIISMPWDLTLFILYFSVFQNTSGSVWIWTGLGGANDNSQILNPEGSRGQQRFPRL